MNKDIYKLEPSRIWHYFGEILTIPRPSKKEERIAKYIVDFGNFQGLETLRDEIGNVLIRKPATAGMEKIKAVVLQSHIDMVGEKNQDKDHDFDRDPIEAYVEEGWVKARDTTLGADCGIGMAAQLAILEARDIQHGPIECLFTVDEETGLTGAFGLKPGFLQGEILLNLDSEDDGLLFIGCAGGKDTVVELPFKKETVPAGSVTYKISVSGLKGGHSGDDIEKGLGNANKILNRALWNATAQFNIRISLFDGGNLRNAIAREALAVITVPRENQQKLADYILDFEKIIRTEYKVTEPDLSVKIKATDTASHVIEKGTQQQLINAVYACPHGVIAMSADIPDFVETSTNLASVKMNEDTVIITTSQRSSVESAKEDVCDMVASVFRLIDAKITQSDGYPGWSPNPNSEIVDITAKLYKKLFTEEPRVLAVHAGLECGLIGDKYPDMDMISFGPTIRGAHSPDERLEISTVQKFWELTLEVLKSIPISG
ncbi:MAG: aminoacyl-histidine dipeptidase [Bacteroidota bacterium]|nr:aminoacyl-histidine dipeptidase [Bacteroidota bacterium]